MARKRDYKAEYARRKQTAQKAGYSSVNSYAKARKALGVPRNASPIPYRIVQRSRPDVLASVAPVNRAMRAMRREAQEWSRTHSHGSRSAYRPSMSDDEVRDFHYAYVRRVQGFSRRRAAREKRRRIGDYVAKWHGVDESEWKQKYELQTV